MAHESPKADVSSAEAKKAFRVSPVWFTPILAILVGAWLLFKHVQNQAIEIQIKFQTAEGIEAGKTKIKALSVDVGYVKSVDLSENRDGVIVVAEIEKSEADLLHKDTRFWVVRPRIDSAGISGLSTVLSGAYIQLDPGVDTNLVTKFEGLENIPISSADTPGARVLLRSVEKNSISVGDPVIYRGYEVGRVEESQFDVTQRMANYSLFVRQPYDRLITENTKFWNVSGVNMVADANGVELNIGSLETLISGGVTFEVPSHLPVGEAVPNATVFTLYEDQVSAYKQRYLEHLDYALLFDRSIRGLQERAPVEYRGIQIGEVVSIASSPEDEVSDENSTPRIPVIVRLEPARIGYEDSADDLIKFQADINGAITKGLVAKLQTGNLITGSLLVELDFDEKGGALADEMYEDYKTIPTSPGQVAKLIEDAQGFIGKLNSLPLNKTVNEANSTLAEIRETINSLDVLLSDHSTRHIPANVNEKTLIKRQIGLDLLGKKLGRAY